MTNPKLPPFDEATLRWRVTSREPLADYRVFRTFRQVAEKPASDVPHEFFVMECPDWVNVLALDADEHVLMVRQFRQGTQSITLELPGGVVDPGETPAQAAQRELREETGYAAAELVALGSVEPNPALQNNRCHFFLARELTPHSALPDADELLGATRLPLAELRALLASGAITHSLTHAAFLRFWLFGAEPRGAHGAAGV